MTDKSSLLHQLRIERDDSPPPAAPRSVRWWVWGGVAVLLFVIGVVWFVLASPGRVPVKAVAAQPAASGAGAAASLLDASGYIVARRQATVSAKITGKVVDVLIEEGQHVEKDQVIARLDDTNATAALAQAEAQRVEANASLQAARLAFADIGPIYRRNKALLAQGWISATAFDNSKSAYDAAEAGLAVAERQVTVAEKGLLVAQRNDDDTIVRAPFAGMITDKAAQPGEMVSPISAGGGFTRTGIGTIVDMDSLEGEIDVSENFINRVHPGQATIVRLNAYPDWQIPGAVIAVVPTADRSKATVKVRVALKQKDPRILPEMGARVSFLADAAETASGGPATAPGVVVPAASVDAKGDTGTVFVIDGDVIEKRAVRLGARTGDEQTILSGVAPGTRLAVGDFAKLADGIKVKVEE